MSGPPTGESDPGEETMIEPVHELPAQASWGNATGGGASQDEGECEGVDGVAGEAVPGSSWGGCCW